MAETINYRLVAAFSAINSAWQPQKSTSWKSCLEAASLKCLKKLSHLAAERDADYLGYPLHTLFIQSSSPRTHAVSLSFKATQPVGLEPMTY